MRNYQVWLSASNTEVIWGFSCENHWNKLKQMFKRNNHGINWINGIDGVDFNNKMEINETFKNCTK